MVQCSTHRIGLAPANPVVEKWHDAIDRFTMRLAWTRPCPRQLPAVAEA
ncbi:hypothetical protein JSMCR1_p636 (plasmid) [Escherichia coli]|nr:hypothetical protein JSMCR1_p636 [Escherichia coli]